MFPFQINPQNIIIERRISQGSLADTYSIIDFSTSKRLALTIAKNKMEISVLEKEIFFFKKLGSIIGVPNLLWAGNLSGRSGYITELFGLSLQDHINNMKKFSMETVVKVAFKLLLILEQIHKRGFLHLDLNPENIVCGTGKNKNEIYLTDYNLSKTFLDEKGKHIPLTKIEEFNGNLEFSSVNSNEFFESSRKDDLESLGYVLSYLLHANVKWESGNSNKKNPTEKIRLIANSKKKFLANIKENDLLPSCLKEYFENICNIGYYDTPNYEVLRKIFRGYAEKEGIKLTNEWEWSLEQKERMNDMKKSKESTRFSDTRNNSDFNLNSPKKQKEFQENDRDNINENCNIDDKKILLRKLN